MDEKLCKVNRVGFHKIGDDYQLSFSDVESSPKHLIFDCDLEDLQNISNRLIRFLNGGSSAIFCEVNMELSNDYK